MKFVKFETDRASVFGLTTLLVVVCLVFFKSASFAIAQQELALQFLDFRSGKPIKGYNFVISVWSGAWTGPEVTKDVTFVSEKPMKGNESSVVVCFPEPLSGEGTVVFTASIKTDRNGRVLIYFPGAIPDHIRVDSFGLAASVPDLSPSKAIKSGQLVMCVENKTDSEFQVSAKPGEIVILNKRITTLDRIRQEIP
jgi:hypothetical protein